MENLENYTSMESNFITTIPYNYSDNIKSTNLNSTLFINNKTLINTTFNNLSSDIGISKNIFENKRNSSMKIYQETLIEEKSNQLEPIDSTNSFIISQSIYNDWINNNNSPNTQNILRTELETTKINNYIYNTSIMTFNNISSDILIEKNINISKNINNVINNSLNESNISMNSNKNNNRSKTFLPKNLTLPIINKAYDTNLVLTFGISIPIILIILIILIYYFIKKKKKSKISSSSNFDINRINFKNPGLNKIPYNKLQNNSNINPNMNVNNISMSEIKVQNLKEEIHNIITNSSGGSNSSGRRKRQKKRGNKNNKIQGSSEKQENKGIQKEIKEQIKKYVIDENINN